MSDRDILMSSLEKYFPEDKSLSPIGMSEFFGDFFEKRGLNARFSYLRENELTQELVSRIKQRCAAYELEIRAKTNYKSEKTLRNTYYQMIFAILTHHHYGIINNKKQLKRISNKWFAKEFEVNRKTLSANLSNVNFYDSNRAIKDLHDIFFRIENEIINN